MKFYWLLLGVLTVWRVTHLLQAEDGPADLVVHLRRLMGHSSWGQAMDCYLCLSVWTALPLAFWCGESWKERALLWPALSGGAILLKLWSENGVSTKGAANEFMLREETNDGINNARPKNN